MFVLVALGVSTATAQEAVVNSESDPTAITLSYFRVVGLPTSIRIEWGTETEFDTAGFFVRRAIEPVGDFADPGIGFVPAQGGELAGFDYSVIDSSVTVGQTYWYKLIEVETSGTENEFGPIPVAAGATPTATAVPLASPGAATSTPPPTSTGFPTSTAAATSAATTATSTPTPTASRTATATPAPSVTPTRTPISVSGNPTATPFVFPSATPASGGSGVVEAAEDLNATPVGTLSAYPGPGSGYPGPQQLLEGSAQPPYPSPENAATAPPFPSQPSLTAYPAEGSSSNNLPPVAGSEQVASEQEAGSGRVLLWVGFAVALVVFAAGVYSAILYFNRRPTGSR